MWPSESLTTLKWSMSRNITPSCGPAPPRAGQAVDEAVGEQRPVGQAGEGVVQGLVGELVFHLLAVGDVLELREEVLRLRPTRRGPGVTWTDAHTTVPSGRT